jgi:uncharacterized protein YueI
MLALLTTNLNAEELLIKGVVAFKAPLYYLKINPNTKSEFTVYVEQSDSKKLSTYLDQFVELRVKVLDRNHTRLQAQLSGSIKLISKTEVYQKCNMIKIEDGTCSF